MSSSQVYELTAETAAMLQLLHDICCHNRQREMQEGLAPEPITLFHSAVIPPVAVVDYGRRLLRYGRCENPTMQAAVIMVLRYAMSTGRRLVFLTVHRLLLSAMVLASKTTSDVFYSNNYYAEIGGVQKQEITALETCLLQSLHFGVWIHDSETSSMAKLAAELLPAFFSENAQEEGRVMFEDEACTARGAAAVRTLASVIRAQRPFPANAPTPAGPTAKADTLASTDSVNAWVPEGSDSPSSIHVDGAVSV